MQQALDLFFDFVRAHQIERYLIGAIIFVCGVALAVILKRRLVIPNLHPQYQLLVRRLFGYVVIVLFATWALREMGFNLGVLLGAAGVLTVALGFAAQTSTSNIISGFFLMAEQPFRVGDVIKVGDVTGIVVTIDLLAVKLRTFDNLMVRIPNESMIKTNVINMTRFPIRRVDLKLGVSFSTDLPRVRELLLQVAEKIPIALDEPPPLFIVLGFGSSSINLQFSVWATNENYLELSNRLYQEIKSTFHQHGIEIPFEHRTLQISPQSTPLSVHLVSDESNPHVS